MQDEKSVFGRPLPGTPESWLPRITEAPYNGIRLLQSHRIPSVRPLHTDTPRLVVHSKYSRPNGGAFISFGFREQHKLSNTSSHSGILGELHLYFYD